LQGETELPAMERGNKSNESKVVARQKYMSFCLRRTGRGKIKNEAKNGSQAKLH